MIMLLIGLALGWLVTGLCDYFVSMPRAYRKGLADGRDATLKQVSGW